MSLFGKKQKQSLPDKIGALKIQSQGYGNVVPIVYGTMRISPLLFFYGNFIAFAVKEKKKSSGKGMGSKSSANITWQYCAAVMMGMTSHEITSTGKLWVDKKVYASVSAPNFEVVGGIIFYKNFSVFTGSQAQTPWGYLSTYEPTKAVNLKGFSYLAANFYLLGENAQLGNHSIEVAGLYPHATKKDANPAHIIEHLLMAECGIPAARINVLTDYANYCVAQDIYFSLALTEQQQASEVITDLLNMTSSDLVIRNGQINIIPYYTAGTVRYHLTTDDFIAERGKPALKPTRKKAIDSFNALKLEFVNRDTDYNIEVVDAKDQASIETIGLRTGETIKAHFVTHAQRAKNLVEFLLRRDLNVRNTYEFTLSPKYLRLEPMDVVSLTDASLGLYQQPVIIKKLVITNEWAIKVTAEDYGGQVYVETNYATHSPEPFIPDQTGSAGDVNAPVIFAAPRELSSDGYEIWCGISSSSTQFGGCEVHVSLDGGASYEKIGVQDGSSRMGVLTDNLPADSQSLDTTHTLKINVAQSNAILNAVDQVSVDTLGTLSRVGNEFLAYRDVTLTAVNQYDLAYLRRGLYGTSQGAITSDTFVRCDDSLFKFPYNPLYAGRTIKIKFPSFNVYGDALQDLSTLPAYDFTIPGVIWDSGASVWDGGLTIWTS